MEAVIIPNNLPVGYRFHPTDEEIIDHYLKNRVRGLVDRPCIIPDVDLCMWDPWDLPQTFHGDSIIPRNDEAREWWFFCPQPPQQVKRSAPSGYWKKTGTDLNVKARNPPRVIGTKKKLIFRRGWGSYIVNTNWVIHEYHLLPNDMNRDYVLCRLKYKQQDEEADGSTVESELGATLADSVSALCLPDDEGSFPEYGQIYTVDNRQIPTIESLFRGFPTEETEGIIQSESYSSHVSSAKPMELPEEPKAPKMPESPSIFSDEEPMFEEVRKQEYARNVKPECVSCDESAAKAKVVARKEHVSASNSPKRTNIEEIEHAQEKSNSVTALARPATKHTKSSTHPPFLILVNVLVRIFLLVTLAAIVTATLSRE